MTWRFCIERTAVKALAIYIRTYSLLKNEHLCINIKLTLYKALIRSIIVHACPAWEYEVDAHILKLKCRQNRFLHAIGNFDRCTLVHKMHMAFKIHCVYNYVIKLTGKTQKSSKIT
jgi:hypothetical protein